jgi:Fe-S-cluster-containing hydrogenase component 2
MNMIRKIIKIDESLCNGCGACAEACHEGAIVMVNDKAKLLRDDYCDGLGDCLPVCPTDAISFVEREAVSYDEAAVQSNKILKAGNITLPCGCPGTNTKFIEPQKEQAAHDYINPVQSQLRQWPVQIKLVPVNAPYFENANLLIAADCTAYAYGDFHEKFIKNRITLIGCPKLDSGSYAEKLTEILKANHIKSITIVRMKVPCCGGIENAAKAALQDCGKMVPWQVFTISSDGKIIED